MVLAFNSRALQREETLFFTDGGGVQADNTGTRIPLANTPKLYPIP